MIFIYAIAIDFYDRCVTYVLVAQKYHIWEENSRILDIN